VERREVLIALLLLVGACARGGDGQALMTPFDTEKAVGAVTAVWRPSGEERGFDAATRLNEPEVGFRYRLDARSDLDDKLFVRLEAFALVDADGLALGTDDASVGCTLAPGRTEGVLAGTVWVPKSAVQHVDGFRVRRLVVPLGERGRALYREWALEGRPGDAAAIDGEIASYAAAAPCAAP
jgi:hypothetical protein